MVTHDNLSKEQFEIAAGKVGKNIMSYLPEMISFKKRIQVILLHVRNWRTCVIVFTHNHW